MGASRGHARVGEEERGCTNAHWLLYTERGCAGAEGASVESSARALLAEIHA